MVRVLLIVLAVVSCALVAPAQAHAGGALKFKLGAGYNRILADKWNAVGGTVSVDYLIAGALSLDLTGDAWFYSVEDSSVGATGKVRNIRPLLGLGYDLGPLYLKAGAGMDLRNVSTPSDSEATSELLGHVTAGRAFPNVLGGLPLFIESRATGNFALKNLSAALLAGVQF